MKYMIMMFGEVSTLWETKSPEWLGEMQAFMERKDQELRQAGEHVDGRGLADISTAKTIVIQDGKAVPTDGPFAEAKESLVGYWIVDVENEERGIEIVSEVVEFTGVPMELRQVMDQSAEM